MFTYENSRLDLIIPKRKEWRAGLLRKLLEKRSAAEVESYLRSWVIDRTPLNSPEQKKIFSELESGIDQLILDIVQLLTDEQRHKCKKKLLSYAKDFEELSAEDP